MLKRVLAAFLPVLAFGLLAGCNSKQAGSAGQDEKEPQPTQTAAEKDYMSWHLANGEGFDCWVSGNNHQGKRSWIWCDADKGPVSCRIIGNGQPGDWRPMRRITVSEDDEQRITPDPKGQFGTAELLPRGTYAVEFKIGTEEFSAVKLVVE